MVRLYRRVAYTAFLARRNMIDWIVLALQLLNRKLHDSIFRWKDIWCQFAGRTQ